MKSSFVFNSMSPRMSAAVLFFWDSFVDHSDMIKEEFLQCENLATMTKGEDVFNTVSSFMESSWLG